jgi:hypothetical protein
MVERRMAFRPLAALALMLAVVGGKPAGGAEVQCEHYEPATVSLAGVVFYRTFVDAQGTPERGALLLLDKPICVEGAAGYPGDPNVGEGDVVVIGLLSDKGEDELAGRRIVVQGTLYHRHTAHHHAAVLITPQKLTIEPSN